MGNVNAKDGVPEEASAAAQDDGSVVCNSTPDAHFVSANVNVPVSYQQIPSHRAHAIPPYDNGGPDTYLGSSDSMAVTPSGSPGSAARSPSMIAPQIPQLPAYHVDELGRSWPSESKQSHDDMEPNIPTLIEWSHGGNDVSVAGSWDNWSTRIPLHKAGKNYTLVKFLPSGVYHYKFIVNGEWRHSPDLPCTYDEQLNASNVLDVQDYVPENIDGVAEFEPPSSPETSYDNLFPSPEDYSKDPPLLPSQLHLTTLNLTPPKLNIPTSTSIRPQHVILNHLFVETKRTTCPVLALGFTQRFRSKYVTVILHKPLHR